MQRSSTSFSVEGRLQFSMIIKARVKGFSRTIYDLKFTSEAYKKFRIEKDLKYSVICFLEYLRHAGALWLLIFMSCVYENGD